MTEQQFIEEVSKLGITLSEGQLKQLNQFYEILIETNQYMNLTRITDKKDVYLKHFYDSLTLAKVVDLNQEWTLCDVGSGAGFPGIVLKIVFPHLKITLLDALQKRVRYLNKVIEELHLSDIEAIHARSEDYARENREKFSIVTARAVASLKVLAEITVPMVKVGGLFLAMKASAEEEVQESQEILKKLNAKIDKIEQFLLPYEESKRQIIVIKKEKESPSNYPRTMDNIKKDRA